MFELELLIITFIQYADIYFHGGVSSEKIYIDLTATVLLLISISGVINIKSINNKIDLAIIGAMGVIPLILFFISRDVTVGFIYLCSINVIFLLTH